MNPEKQGKTFAALMLITVTAASAPFLLMLLWPPFKPVLRHVNPGAESEQPPFSSFFTLLVTGVFDSLIGGDYAATVESLKTLVTAYVPEKYRFIASRFTQLLNETTSLLSSVEELLDKAESLVNIGRGEDARPLLHEASAKLASANVTCMELREACDELAKAFSLPTGDLRNRVEKLGGVISMLHARILRLMEMVERQTMLEDSFLTISVKPSILLTGGSIQVSGKLYAGSSVLAGRSVQILVDGAVASEAETLDNGEFNAQVSLPYVYKPRVAIQAKYTPKGLDREAYRPSASNTVEVSLIYFRPKIIVETVGEALPGKTFVLRGRVESEQPPPYSSLKSSWAGGSLTLSLVNGAFEATLRTPENIPDGEYLLRVEAPASGVYAPAQATLKIRVQRLPLNVELKTPTVVFAGLASSLGGKILYDDERFNVTVKAFFAGQSYTANSSGEFSIPLAIPLTFLTGYLDYEVQVSPSLLWYGDAALSGSILVVNPFAILASASVVSALTLRLSRGREPRVGGAKPVGTLQAQQEQPSAVEKYSVSQGLEWLIDAYWRAVIAVSSLTGVEMKPSATLREYLAAVEQGLGSLRGSFRTLTMTVEKALYSPSVSLLELRSARRAFEEIMAAHVEA